MFILVILVIRAIDYTSVYTKRLCSINITFQTEWKKYNKFQLKRLQEQVHVTIPKQETLCDL